MDVKQNLRFPFIKYVDDLNVLLKGKGNVVVWRLANSIVASVPGFKKPRIILFYLFVILFGSWIFFHILAQVLKKFDLFLTEMSSH